MLQHEFAFIMCYNVFRITIIIYKSMSVIDTVKQVGNKKKALTSCTCLESVVSMCVCM